MLGYGLGLRSKFYQDVLEKKPEVDWFEVVSENFIIPGGRPRRILEQIRADYPVVIHGVSLSIGSVDPLNQEYLKSLGKLAAEVQPEWISDHLCWGSINGHYAHDLLPLPYTKKALKHVAARVSKVQDFMKRQILLENVSTYLEYKASEMTEWEFLTEVVALTGCGLLVDINNIYVSSRNHGFDPKEFIRGIPASSVGQFHLAGHSDNGTHLIDTHDHDVCNDVWKLYKYACERFGSVATMIERDDHIPEFDELYKELMTAKKIQEKVLNGKPVSSKNSERILEVPDQRI